MELLKEWLGKTIEQELGEVLEWRSKSDKNRSQVTGKVGDLTFDEDGSNLRIRSARPRVVQIIKFMPNDEPLQASLSDTVNRVNATIAKEAVQQYREKYKKRLTDGTIGGLIQLIDFEIVATHIGSRQKRLTLFVTDFKSLGSNGSGEYGVPQAIEDRQQIGELIQKLIDFRRRESAGNRVPSRQERASKASSAMSQPGNISSQEDTYQASQIFASQVPPQRTRVSSLKTTVSSNSIDSHPAISKAAPKELNLLGNVNTGRGCSQLPQALASPASHISNGKKSPTTADEDLLSLLQQAKRVPKQVASKKPTPAAQQSLVPSFSHEIGTSFDSIKAMLPPTAAASKSRDVPQRRGDLASQPSSPRTAVEEHFAGTIIAATRTAPSKPGSETKSRNRIKRRDLKIPKDQEELLSSVDSWLPAEPGKRDPVANIPISILHTLNRDADLRTKRSAMARGQGTHVALPNGLKNVRRSPSRPESESDSDAPLSSSEWPASPDGNQLPPDSSAGSENLVQAAVGPLSRRSSNGSAWARAVPPSPLRSMESPNVSGEASPGLFSPSLASTSTGEESQPFKCGAIGCDKLFRNPGSLKKHMKRNHSDEGLDEGFKCHIHGCEKSHTDSDGLESHILYDHHDEGSQMSDSRCGTPTSIASQAFTSVSAEMKISTLKSRESTKKYVANNRDKFSAIPKLNGREYSPEDAEPQSQHLMTASASPTSASTPGFLVQPFQVKSASEDINYIDKGVDNCIDAPLSLRSRPPSPSSDIEISATIPLNDQTRPFTNRVPLQDLPSTAPPPVEPYLQVKHTPYVNGHIQNHSPPRSELQMSPSKLKYYSSMNDALEDVDHVTQSAPSVQETSSSEICASRLNDVPLGDGQNVEKGQISTSTSEGIAVPAVQLETNPQIHEPQGEKSSQKDSTAISSGIIPESMSPFGKGNEVLSESAFIDSDKKVKIAEKFQSKTLTFDSPDTFHKEMELAQDQATKRKAPDLSLLFPSVSKRRKRFKVPMAFAFTERMEDRRDPVEGARRYREEFMASRRSSEASTPIGSPTTPTRSLIKQPSISSMNPREIEISNNDPDRQAKHVTLAQDHPAADDSMAIDREFLKSTTQLPNLDIDVDDARRGPLNDHPMELDNVRTKSGAQDDASVMYELDTHVDNEIIDTNNRQLESDGQVAQLIESLPDPMPSHVQEDPPEASTSPKTPSFEADSKTREPVAQGPIQTDMNAPMPDAQKDQPYDFESKTALMQLRNNILPTPISKFFPAPRAPAAPLSEPELEVEVQSHIALEDPSSRDIPLLDSEMKKPTVIAPLEKAELQLPSAPQSIFDQFKITYPTYPGDVKHFIAICKKISNLSKFNRMPHQALWDDFIVRHKTEYAQHLRRCAEDAEDALSYEAFYHTEIEVPLYRSRIITRTSLEEVLSLADPKASEAKKEREHEIAITSLTQSSSSTKQYEHENSRTPPITSTKSRASFEPAKSRRQDQKPSEKPFTIDLTQDDQDHDLGKMPEKDLVTPRLKTTEKTRRSLPWSDVGTDHKARTGQRSPVELDEIGLSFNPSGNSSSNRVKPSTIIKETTSKRTLDRLSCPQAEVTDETGDEERPGEWWQDENTPFKSFARAYNLIRPGNGNSYAKSESTNTEPGNSRRTKHVAGSEKRINPLDWEL